MFVFFCLEKYVSCGIDRASESTSHWAMESCEVQIVLTKKEGKPKGKSNLVKDLLNNIGEMGWTLRTKSEQKTKPFHNDLKDSGNTLFPPISSLLWT